MTTQTLEEVLRNLAAHGMITHISLVPSQNGKSWRASFAPSKTFGIIFAEDADPAKALLLALASKRAPPPPKRPAALDLKAEHVEVPPPDDDHADLM